MLTTLKTILLVEDNQDDEALAMRAMRLTDLPNAMVVARDGVEALDLLFADGTAGAYGKLPSLILLDLKLPKVSGIELLKRIRAHDRTKSIPVVILSSSDQEQDIEDAYAFGANSYIIKPVDFEEFVEAVRQLCLYWLSINKSVA